MIPHADKTRGGAEAYLFALARYVQSQGHEVTLLCQTAGEVPRGVEVKTFEVSGNAAQRLLKFWNALDAYLEKNTFDIVHSLDVCPRMNVHNPHGGAEGVWLQQYLKSKTGFEKWWSGLKRQFGSRQKVMFDLEKKQIEDPELKKIIAISPFVKESLQKSYDIDENKFTLLPNGIDTSLFYSLPESKRDVLRARYEIDEDQKLIIFVAHNFALKGLRPFIKIIAAMKKKNPDVDLRAWVIGGGRPAVFRSLADSLGLSSVIEFKGRMENMPEVYNIADLTVAPSYYDACSLSTLESLLCGTAVVTTATNGAALYIREGVTGAVVPTPDDIDLACDYALEFLQDSLARKSRIAAPASVAHFTQKANSEAVLAIYSDLLS